MLRTHICTDGNPYKLSMIVHSAFNPIQYYVMILDKTKDWVTLEIPLANFLLSGPEDTIKQRLIIEPDSGLIINMLKLGIYSPDKSEGNFCLKLKDISLVYRDDADIVSERYPHHVMFKHQESYNRSKYLDTGMSLIALKQ